MKAAPSVADSGRPLVMDRCFARRQEWVLGWLLLNREWLVLATGVNRCVGFKGDPLLCTRFVPAL
jgi:hypothetical protein